MCVSLVLVSGRSQRVTHPSSRLPSILVRPVMDDGSIGLAATLPLASFLTKCVFRRSLRCAPTPTCFIHLRRNMGDLRNQGQVQESKHQHHRHGRLELCHCCCCCRRRYYYYTCRSFLVKIRSRFDYLSGGFILQASSSSHGEHSPNKERSIGGMFFVSQRRNSSSNGWYCCELIFP